MNAVDDCPFCEIVAGRRDAEVVAAYEHCVAFKPLGRPRGRLLVVPRIHAEALDVLPNAVLGSWMGCTVVLARQLGVSAYKVQVNVGPVYQNVAHLHMHFTYPTRG